MSEKVNLKTVAIGVSKFFFRNDEIRKFFSLSISDGMKWRSDDVGFPIL